MDPLPLTNLDWKSLELLISSMWLAVLLIAAFGGSFLTAHVLLPYLVSAGAPRGQLDVLRLLFYSFAGAAFAAAVFVVAQRLGQVPSILHFYSRFWM